MLAQDAEKNQKVPNPVSNSLGTIIEKPRGRREGAESAPARKRVKAKVIKQISVFFTENGQYLGNQDRSNQPVKIIRELLMSSSNVFHSDWR